MMGKELEIEMFLNMHNINVFCVTEHWFRNYELLFNFNDHQLSSSFCRENAIRGGSLILVSKCLKCKERKDVVALSVERIIEISCVELEHLIVVCVYRPPDALYDSFENILENALLKLSVSNKHVFICGDFNINLLKSTNATIRLRTLLKSYNLSNLFSEPTRITSTSATCIDNIFTNVKPLHKCIINHLSSDHSGQFLSFKIKSVSDVNSTRKLPFVPINIRRLEKLRGKVLAKIPNV
ncbi:endonuclease/exonuclease/phosphatase family protein, partial [Pseudomonas aeruginosa]